MPRARKAFKVILAILHVGVVIAVTNWVFAQESDIPGSVKNSLNNRDIQRVIATVKKLSTGTLAGTRTTDALGTYSGSIPDRENETLSKQVPTDPADPVIREFVKLVNAKRLAAGCPMLKWDDRIAAIALAHSRDMVARNFFSHTNPDGKDSFERLKESSLFYCAAAENLALGPKTGKEVFRSWLNSPEHRRNMLACRYTRHGVGRKGDRWTHLLLNP